MKKQLMVVLVTMAVAMVLRAEEFRLVSYNIKCDSGQEKTPGRTWKERLPKLVKIAQAHTFDLVGLQEVVTEFQLKGLKESFPDYGITGCGRLEGKTGEGTYILYRKSMFELVKEGSFMVSETPTIWGSKSWGAACPRVCNWGLFKFKESGREFYFFNTHLDHVSKEAQVKGMEMIVAKIKEIAGKVPVFLTGDMNTGNGTKPIREAEKFFANAYEVSQMPCEGPERTWNNWEVEENRSKGARIDFIFLPKSQNVAQIKDLAVLEDQIDDGYPSDHFPLIATVNME